jgi:hypothetical protein
MRTRRQPKFRASFVFYGFLFAAMVFNIVYWRFDQRVGDLLLGLFFVLVSAETLRDGFAPGGSFPSRWPFPRVRRTKDPVSFWAQAATLTCIGLIGIYCVLHALFIAH